ncbi:hypothetical protein D9757_008640 [Collybiopsis confluens]|uniref:Uncharacterized protein n=1 Tax=Collybiopsis confluens TaxID=2823264 RepID=A0A8H5H418_9AGAR|nr:hypothetical protein D9757_008640 [Collybiopsis confluens]
MEVPASYSLPRLIIVMVRCVLYGVYLVMFGFAMWILPRKFNIPSVKKFFFPVIIALFVLTTVNTVYDLVGEAYAILYTIPIEEKTWMIAGQSIDLITLILADILGDIVLFYRVYTVWGFRKKLLLPVLLVILVAKDSLSKAFSTKIDRFADYLSTLFSRDVNIFTIFAIVDAIANLLMTFLIAGRIWWISRWTHLHRELQPLPPPPQHLYHRTIAVIIWSHLSNLPYTTITIGLAPTLIAVRVGLGSAYDNQALQTAMRSSMVFFPHNPGSRDAENALASSNYNVEESAGQVIEDGQEKLGQVV